MGVVAFAVFNFVLAASVVTAITWLHVWAIRTAHRDHVAAVEVAQAPIVERDEQLLPDDLLVAPALA